MRTHLLALVFVLALTNAWTQARAEDQTREWELLENSEGVTSWKLDSAKSTPLLKAEVEIAASVDVVQQVLLDGSHHTKWMHKCIESVVVEPFRGGEMIVYNRTDSPWPVKDRDVVFKLKRMPSSTDQERVFSFETVRSPMKPEVDGVVRVPRMVGSWRLIALGAKKTRVVYQLDTSTGGSVPGWAVKGTLERIPFETLRGLRNLIAKR